MGVKSISLEADEVVVDATKVRENTEVMTITENGYGKRTDISEYRFQTRGGKGVKVGVLNEKTGNVVNLKLVSEDEDVMIISDNGIVIRMNADKISKIGRNTQGVKVMRMKDQASKVVSFTIVPRDELEEELLDENGEVIVAESADIAQEGNVVEITATENTTIEE